MCFDTETTSLNALEAELVGIAFSWTAEQGYYLALPEDRNEVEKLLAPFNVFFEHPEIEKIGHNLKYDLKVLRNYGIVVQAPLFDTMVAPLPRQPRHATQHGYFGRNLPKLQPSTHHRSDWQKREKSRISMRDVPLEQQTEYAVEDADMTLQLKAVLLKKKWRAARHLVFISRR